MKKYVYDFEDLLHLKITCKNFNELITSFSIRKLMLHGKLPTYKPAEYCINIDCYDDTCDIYEDVYHYGYRCYIHTHQLALNKTNITINKKQHTIHTPYCAECFKKHILIGDKQNVTDNLIMDEVNIDY